MITYGLSFWFWFHEWNEWKYILILITWFWNFENLWSVVRKFFKRYTWGPRYCNVPVLVNTGISLAYLNYSEMWYLKLFRKYKLVEAYYTGTQKWSSIVQYLRTSIWDLKNTFSKILIHFISGMRWMSNKIRIMNQHYSSTFLSFLTSSKVTQAAKSTTTTYC